MTQLVLGTGANGFVGRAVCERLHAQGVPFVAATRTPQTVCERASVAVGPVCKNTTWSQALEGCASVIHLAARVHVMRDSEQNPLQACRQVNVDGTLALAQQAVRAGVRRFVFVSSIKVNGEHTLPGHPFRADDTAAPTDAYASSKYEAEQELFELGRQTGLEVVVVRPPLVYGFGAKANFGQLMRWVALGRHLPLGAITHNRRSLIGVDNLADLLLRCVVHPAAAGRVFLASDAQDVSTAELVQRIGLALNRPSRLLRVPVPLLEALARLTGRKAFMQRLSSSLQLDITDTQSALDWQPPLTLDEGLRRAATAA